MRYSESDSPSSVLKRLLASEPQPPKSGRVDYTFAQRHLAWEQAVAREQARLEK